LKHISGLRTETHIPTIVASDLNSLLVYRKEERMQHVQFFAHSRPSQLLPKRHAGTAIVAPETLHELADPMPAKQPKSTSILFGLQRFVLK
jgi:hypothetical protein